MTTIIEYALMAGASYISTRPDINKFPTPSGWTQTKHENPQNGSGFEAVSFINGANLATSTEIVISFAGTGSFGSGDWLHGNIPLALGALPDQLRQAADYYLQVKASAPANATISFTGHSLGGGLASLMAVMFGGSATTFDQAPFRNAALSITHSVAQDLLAYLTGETTNGQPTYSTAQLQGLTGFINASANAASGVIPNEGNVTDINVQGEILSSLPFSRIGTQTDIPNNNPGASAVDLHSQALLTAFFQSNVSASVTGDTLNNVTYKLTDLLRMVFDPSLFAHPTSDPQNLNFLELIVNHEAGRDPLTNTTITPDAMVTRFTADMWKIAQDGGLTMPGAISDMLPDGTLLNPIRTALNRTLIAFAMQKYYEETGTGQGHGQALYTDITTDGGTGGIRFDITDVSTRLQNEYANRNEGMNFTATDDKTGQYLLKGYQYLQQFIGSSLFTAQEQQIIKSMLPVLRDWYVQAGTSGMTATDTLNRGAFMLGGNGADTLTGGTKADLLVGNAGDDVLNGGQGSDTLLGGIGVDTYVLNTGTGQGIDTVLDSDRRGYLRDDTASSIVLTGGTQYGDNRVFRGKDANGASHLYTFVSGDRATGGDLLVDGAVLIKDWRPNAGNHMGITFSDAVAQAAPQTTTTFVGSPALKEMSISSLMALGNHGLTRNQLDLQKGA